MRYTRTQIGTVIHGWTPRGHAGGLLAIYAALYSCTMERSKASYTYVEPQGQVKNRSSMTNEEILISGWAAAAQPVPQPSVSDSQQQAAVLFTRAGPIVLFAVASRKFDRVSGECCACHIAAIHISMYLLGFQRSGFRCSVERG
jgi:hypothetical protein